MGGKVIFMLPVLVLYADTVCNITYCDASQHDTAVALHRSMLCGRPKQYAGRMKMALPRAVGPWR